MIWDRFCSDVGDRDCRASSDKKRLTCRRGALPPDGFVTLVLLCFFRELLGIALPSARHTDRYGSM